MQPVILVSLCLVAISAAQRFASSAGWDPTQRDKTALCHELAQYAPNAEIYCKQFTLCCDSNYDPQNGDRCQHKVSRNM
ncbi:hypothetical protein WR25_16610 [Diploscapter pachys]|uniref:Uncharacterized protein n=1 Tax=Diploscapter pachys TaxID=2018661 RepID=A0A2A2KXE3_9BILA|nr:hypothetical protein WR25_16610 [Diploscapter pachys]